MNYLIFLYLCWSDFSFSSMLTILEFSSNCPTRNKKVPSFLKKSAFPSTVFNQQWFGPVHSFHNINKKPIQLPFKYVTYLYVKKPLKPWSSEKVDLMKDKISCAWGGEEDSLDIFDIFEYLKVTAIHNLGIKYHFKKNSTNKTSWA